MTSTPAGFPVVRRERTLAAPPHAVYRAWLDLVPDRRIVWRWGFIGPDREAGPVFDSLLTVTLAETPDGGTRLILLHEQLDALATALPDVAEQVGGGWDSVLDRLTVAVKE